MEEWKSDGRIEVRWKNGRQKEKRRAEKIYQPLIDADEEKELADKECKTYKQM